MKYWCIKSGVDFNEVGDQVMYLFSVNKITSKFGLSLKNYLNCRIINSLITAVSLTEGQKTNQRIDFIDSTILDTVGIFNYLLGFKTD